MKQLIILVVLFSPVLGINAQPRPAPLTSATSIKSVVEKVARDYYQNFNNIKGDTINQTVSTIEFKSKISPTGSIATSIIKYIDPYSYTWQSTLFESEDFQASADKYKDYYHQLNGCTLTFYDKTSYKLSGNYDIPDEDRSFASSILQLDSSNRDLRLFKVEVALNYTMPTWTVKVMIYEKVADEDIRPTVN